MIQKYIAFVKAAETGSFTHAAKQLNYTQSGVSRMIQDLEKEWGVVLFERSKLGITLTAQGKALLPQLQRICNEHERLERQLHEMHHLESGTIRIGTFSSVATHWLPQLIKQFKQQYPHIEFELLLGDYQEIEQWIIEGRVDFGFLRTPTVLPMETIVVARDRLLVVMPASHPLADMDIFPMKALEESPFMLLEKGENDEISRIFAAHNVQPHVEFVTWDDYAIMSMVEHEMGISILPELILQRIPYKIITKELEVPAYREIAIGVRMRNTLTFAAQRFLQFIEQTI